ncbi:hypothetical protein IHE44_0005695 [Lamprotornis superbus]|uniref:Uncharacterized protein n=1 Tax=Lamprotornis superbus TaxID=245042 RepID=A0A835TUN3_9PASS|nr:hypothetical protein IHE44_0005695 [Lamprotornis superbus]
MGFKPIRHKPNNKFMATSGGTGRSPLSILQDDNSPSAPAPRQGKRHMLGENLGEKKEMDLSRSLKSGNCAWSDLNKENQQCPFGVPDVAVEVIIASKYKPPTAGESNGGDSTDDGLVGVHDELLVCPQVEEAAGGIVRAGADGFAHCADSIHTEMALMSDSCPEKVWRQEPSRTSHSLAVASQAPEMKSLKSGETAKLMQSPV